MYKIKLSNFEGPFDLLLYFIKRDEIDIYDIPIARITEEFLKYIRLMQIFDLELAGEFILMASTLLSIKSQMLLPRNESDDSSEQEDPRRQIVQRLLEYRQFKDAAAKFSTFEENQKYIYYRQILGMANDLSKDINSNEYQNSTLFDLIRAFQKALDRKNIEPQSQLITANAIPIEKRIEDILQELNLKKRISFFELTQFDDRISIIVSFLAILELIKINKISIVQNNLFDDIIVITKQIEISSPLKAEKLN